MGNQGNGVASTIFKTIFILLGVYLMVVNITLWATSSNVGMRQIQEFANEQGMIQVFDNYNSGRMKDFGYVGFENFFDFLSTFPGLKFTQGVTDTYLNIVDGYNITGIGIVDALLGIVRIISAPFLLTMTVVADIIHNAIWFLQFLAIVPSTPSSQV